MTDQPPINTDPITGLFIAPKHWQEEPVQTGISHPSRHEDPVIHILKRTGQEAVDFLCAND